MEGLNSLDRDWAGPVFAFDRYSQLVVTASYRHKNIMLSRFAGDAIRQTLSCLNLDAVCAQRCFDQRD
jgi:hypothetical protein